MFPCARAKLATTIDEAARHSTSAGLGLKIETLTIRAKPQPQTKTQQLGGALVQCVQGIRVNHSYFVYPVTRSQSLSMAFHPI